MNATVLALLACAALIAVVTVLGLMVIEYRQKLTDAHDDYDDLKRSIESYKRVHAIGWDKFPAPRRSVK